MGRVTALVLASALLILAARPGHAIGEDIVTAARSQVGVTVHYDPAYQRIRYPNGDVAPERGVCTDVIIRALRRARGLDLQRAVHEDLVAHAGAYPRRWRCSGPDTNIDHRRVPNLMTFFKRRGYERPISATGRDYLPGDIVAWDLGGGTLHIGIVSDRKTDDGTPLVVHNIGAGAREEDMLFNFRVIGHYRL
ncbi:MAG TPA: DUF1287 domain-containing protein [Steroidobacteraceae bacterium]